MNANNLDGGRKEANSTFLIQNKQMKTMGRLLRSLSLSLTHTYTQSVYLYRNASIESGGPGFKSSLGDQLLCVIFEGFFNSFKPNFGTLFPIRYSMITHHAT
jgi:hypothetical protein